MADVDFIIQISLCRVLKAALVFKGIMIEWVTVKGFDESFEEIDDLWSESRYKVFRKVQDHTHSAMLHFFSPALPELAVRSFLVRPTIETILKFILMNLYFFFL